MMFCIIPYKLFRCIKIDSLKLINRQFISFYSGRNAVNSSICDMHRNFLQVHNERNYSSIGLENKFLSLTNHNLTYFQNNQRRNFSLESVAQIPITVSKYLSECTAVEYTQNLIIFIHDSTGLPWWASIILTTCFFRSFVTVPLALYQHYILARLANLSSEMAAILDELKWETAVAVKQFQWTEQQAKFAFSRSAKKQWTQLIERDNCHPVKASLLIWFQIPMWVIISSSLRNIVYMMPYPDAVAQIRFFELSVGGCLWFPNLTLVDPWILPFTMGLVNLTIIEIQALMRISEPSKLQRYLTNFFRGVCILMIPLAATVPSCLTLYWASSSVFGLCQNLSLMSPRIKQLVGIPKTKNDIDKPYTHLMRQIKNRFKSG